MDVVLPQITEETHKKYLGFSDSLHTVYPYAWAPSSTKKSTSKKTNIHKR